MNETLNPDTLGPPGRDWRPQYERMMACMLDIPRDEIAVNADAGSRGTDRHKGAFDSYLPVALAAIRAGSEWFEGFIQIQEGRLTDRAAAIQECWEFHPAGPATYEDVISAVREAWLTCDSINRDCSEDQRVFPPDFVLAWLLAAGETEAVKIICCIPYWPIGLDENGNWC